MAYGLSDIEIMISNLPKSGTIPSLDATYPPQRRHIKTKSWHLPFHTNARKIINCLLENAENLSSESIPYFIYDMKRQFPQDKSVIRLSEMHYSS